MRDAAGGRSFADGDGVDFLAPRQHVDDRILDERAEHKDEAGGHPDVDRLRERDGRKPALAGALRRYRQHRQDAERDASRHRLEVDPEGHPRQQDDQHARQVRGEDVGAQATCQVEIGPEARELSYSDSNQSRPNTATRQITERAREGDRDGQVGGQDVGA